MIQKSPLFSGIEEASFRELLNCMNGRITVYKKGSSIWMAGDPAERIGVILAGTVKVMRDDYLGNRGILTVLKAGEIFGETFVCAGIESLPVSLSAVTESRVLFLDYRRIITACSPACPFHARLIENMLRILAEKNLYLNAKIEILSARTTREKLLTYLLSQARSQGKDAFTIPFNRQELADYLAVDRSALSRELGRLRAEGLISFNKNYFEIKKTAIK